jgi:hypothetical protein
MDPSVVSLNNFGICPQLVFMCDYHNKQLLFSQTALTDVGFEVLTAVVMKSFILWDITPYSPFKVNQPFGGTSLLHLQGRRISEARNRKVD